MENLLIYCIGISLLILLIVIIIQSNQNTSKTINLTRFEKKVTQLLDQEGITWKKEDGEMYVIKCGTRFDTYFSEIQGRTTARVYFAYRTVDEELKPISGWGQLIMSDQLNQWHVGHTTFVKNNNMQSFCYADIKDAEDFLIEFNRAYEQFSNIISDYDQLKPLVLKDYPAPPH